MNAQIRNMVGWRYDGRVGEGNGAEEEGGLDPISCPSPLSRTKNICVLIIQKNECLN